MTQVRFYGSPLPNFAETELPGKFIVIEGTDGVGRSTQIALLQEWLAKWVPVSVAAARQLQPVWSQVSEKVVSFEDSFDGAKARFGELLAELGLQSPKEL